VVESSLAAQVTSIKEEVKEEPALKSNMIEIQKLPTPQST
jgi:hypothetical protein